MSFSSYAGYLESLDDFYIMDRYEHVTRDFKIVHYGRLGRLEAYTGGLGPGR